MPEATIEKKTSKLTLAAFLVAAFGIGMQLAKCFAARAAWELKAFKVDALTGKPVK